MKGKRIRLKWTAEEDRQLTTAINIYGTDSWSNVANFVLSRNEKQCKERWAGTFSLNISKSKWTSEEDQILITKQSEIGNKWTLISTFLPGRSATNVKNRWNKLKKKQGSTELDMKLNNDFGIQENKPKMYYFPSLNDLVFDENFERFQKSLLK